MKKNSILLSLLLCSSLHAGETSPLWGKNGELWKPGSRLPDFSYAGYHRGEKPLPNLRAERSVKDFGAKGDGKTDDTAAFQKALQKGGVIAVPAGKYILSGIVKFTHSNTILQGARNGKSTLYFQKSLTDIAPKPTKNSGGTPTSSYSWSGGLIDFSGKLQRKKSSPIQSYTKRGSKMIKVKKSSTLRKGMFVMIEQKGDSAKSLIKYLYANDPGELDNLAGEKAVIKFFARIVSKRGNTLELDRPMSFDLRKEWQPKICEVSSSLTECAIENLTIEFPREDYKGHFSEKGFNALNLSNCHNCWAKNIFIKNCDSGIFAAGWCNTFSGITFESNRKTDRRKNSGHHGFSFFGHDCLLIDFDFKTRFIHDITATTFKSGNVATRGKAVELALDHHKKAPFANLFCDIDVGSGSRLMHSGGGAKIGKNSAAWTTLWNIRSTQPIKAPADSFAPSLINIIGINSKDSTTRGKKWFEPIPPQKLLPQNLYLNQLKKRLRKR